MGTGSSSSGDQGRRLGDGGERVLQTDPEIDEVNRHLLAFAAYNAGPNRIARLRRLAPEYGLDPNKWFKNVQYIVASKVGQEPVRYVGNIYKYYLAYRRLRDIERERENG